LSETKKEIWNDAMFAQCLCLCACVVASVSTSLCLFLCLCTYVFVRVCVFRAMKAKSLYDSRLGFLVFRHTYTHTYTLWHAQTHVYTHTRTRIHTHTYTHIQTRENGRNVKPFSGHDLWPAAGAAMDQVDWFHTSTDEWV